ncbi:solute carrier organic anion transporter family member 4C1 isoform X1 [Crotalus tigris]|uniref:solute carrier organic anion transporter family member 4C1 isoform X1 n=1 Tax=Crotalus tigris TaxID=88082 RepID=UPI00192F1694|nr:solute carrier organic anion transporter family member 4C1 isoform X1 [Crotalus tigris]
MKKAGLDNPAFQTSNPDLLDPQLPSVSPSILQSQSFDPDDQLCGIGRCTPRALQVCNNVKGYLVFYSLLSVFQGIIVNGLINVSISTIEKRYDLSSSLTGVISAGYDISFSVLCLFISFYGERGHKPRWLALSSFLIALGALVFSLPHFTSEPYTYGEKAEDICPVPLSGGQTISCRPGSRSKLSNYFYVFLLGQFLLGAGGTPLYTLGTTFIDDSVPKHQASVYIGIGYAMSLLGPAIGYVLGGQLLNIYVDFNRNISVDLTPEDPRWVGAWWIAFVICSFSTCLLVAPFSYFPKHLPGTSKIRAEKISEAHHNGKQMCEYTGKSIKDFLMILWMLLRNPVLMYLVIAAALEALVATGFATFLPKFIENQFGFTSSYSATLGGLVLIPGAALGQIISGTLVSKLQMNCKTIIKFIIVTCTIALLLNLVFAIAKCGNEPFAGVSETYNGTGMLSNLTAPCNAHCRCLRSDFLPICGADEVQYFSPCYAGCTAIVPQKHGTKHYSNCSCVMNPIVEIQNTFHGATSGKCKSKCKVLPWFLSFFFFAVVFTFMAVTPTTVAILRCVPENHRSFALGVHMLFLRILGTIPGPILFGISIDDSCTLWSVDKCGRKGACWTYNNNKMAYLLFGISACSKAVSLIFTIIACVLYKPPPDIIADSKTQDQTSTSVRL